MKPLEDFLRLLHTTLMNASPIDPTHPLEGAKALSKKGVSVPYPAPQPSVDTAWKVAFRKPDDVLVVGSWATKSGAKSSNALAWTVDLAIEMPPVNEPQLICSRLNLQIRVAGSLPRERLPRQSVFPQTGILSRSSGMHHYGRQTTLRRRLIRLCTVGYAHDDAPTHLQAWSANFG